MGVGLVAFPVRVANADVVWLRSVLEAYEGLAQLYGDGTGQLLVITPAARVAEVDTLLDELCREIQLERT